MTPSPCLPTRAGSPWTYSGFSTVWLRFRKDLEKADTVRPGLTLKGLRHTVATILREIGCDERTIADLLGQRTPSMARHYSDRADLTRKNAGTVKLYSDEIERRTKLSNRAAKSVKPDHGGER